jgi:hypothetical protein
LLSILSDERNLMVKEPNATVKWLLLLLCIQEILGSNLSLETDYILTGAFCGFSQSLQANAGIVPEIKP